MIRKQTDLESDILSVLRQPIRKSRPMVKRLLNDSSEDASKNSSAPSAPVGGPTDAQDLTVFVQSLLEQMQSRFAQMSDAIIGRIDEMGSRIDELEKSIGDLMERTTDDVNDKDQDLAATEAKDNSERV